MSIVDPLIIAGEKFSSRLFTGTGKFSSVEVMRGVLESTGTQMITVALRRVDLSNPDDNILGSIDRQKYRILPNTSGARNAEEAVRLARMAKATGISNWIKLEVIPEPRYLMPDGEETLKAARILIKEGFVVLPYIQADLILAKKLEEEGTATVMPLASPIGSNQGLRMIDSLRAIIEQVNIPVVIDAGIGRPSDAALAMELGADAVLVNTAIATAHDAVSMGRAFRLSTEAGRIAYLAGLASSGHHAFASSPLEWLSRK